MRRMQLTPLNPEQINELDRLYRTTRDVRLRTRAQMILLADEQDMSAPVIAEIVRGCIQRCFRTVLAVGA